LRVALKTAYDQTPSTDALQQLAGLDTEIARVTETTQVFQNQLKDAAVTSVKGFFTDLVSGAVDAGTALKNLASNFAKLVGEIVAQKLALAAINALFGGLGVPVQHAGGMAGTGPRRLVNPMLFAGAPRFHSGGMAGLKQGEVPAILQRGEEVLSKNDGRNAQNGGGGGGYRIVNVIDPAITGDYLESAAGEKTILNVISRNPGQVRQMLGNS
jgi:hypothetical protein